MPSNGTGWRGRAIATVAIVLLLAGCGRKAITPSPPPPVVAHMVPRPVPPSGAVENLKLPESDGKGGYRTVNSDISPIEAMWHLRSAINVAALACDRSGTLGIAAAYNQMLGHQRAALATAYRAESTRFRSAGAADAHITQIYNFFAQPPAQARFCATAAAVAAEAGALPADGLVAFAPDALARLTAPFTDFYDDYARYEVALADWDRRRTPIAAAPVMLAAVSPAAAGPPWRIQLGAYSGDGAARGAWERIRKRMKGATGYEPRYEAVPGSALVRIRVGPVSDRGAAITLCAAAAGAGLDCLPVPPKG